MCNKYTISRAFIISFLFFFFFFFYITGIKLNFYCYLYLLRDVRRFYGVRAHTNIGVF